MGIPELDVQGTPIRHQLLQNDRSISSLIGSFEGSIICTVFTQNNQPNGIHFYPIHLHKTCMNNLKIFC